MRNQVFDRQSPVKNELGRFFLQVNRSTIRSENQTLSSERYNGVTQQSFFIVNPLFFPTIPPLSTLTAAKQPQQLQYLF